MTGINFSGIPMKLQVLDQWVVWRKEQIPGKEKPTKVLYQARSPYQKASSIAPFTWCSFDAAKKMFELMSERFNGVGFVFTPEDPFAGIDYDDVIIGGILIPEVREEIDEINSYTEISQSGEGLHVIVEATSPYQIGGIPKQCKISAYGTLNSTSRYFAITGNVLDQHTTIELRQEIINSIFQKNKPVISVPVRTSTRPLSSRKIGDDWGVRIEEFMPDNSRDMGAGRYQGGNPFHGSTTGNNYSVDTREGVWHCYRDKCGGTGGDALIAFCVREGLLDCSDCKPGVMSKIDYSALFRKLDECGYKNPEKERRNRANEILKKIGCEI